MMRLATSCGRIRYSKKLSAGVGMFACASARSRRGSGLRRGSSFGDRAISQASTGCASRAPQFVQNEASAAFVAAQDGHERFTFAGVVESLGGVGSLSLGASVDLRNSRTAFPMSDPIELSLPGPKMIKTMKRITTR